MAKRIIGGYTVCELRKMAVDFIVSLCLTLKEYFPMLAAPKAVRQYFVDLSLSMTGKMFYVLSLSTSCLKNALCKKHMAVPGAICNHCFAEGTLEQYDTLRENTEKNLEFFSSHLMDDDECFSISWEIVCTLKKNGTHLFRLESFGDISNSVHCANYIKLCATIGKCAEMIKYDVSIGWWTKNYHLFSDALKLDYRSGLDRDMYIDNQDIEYFRKHTNVILSSLFIGVEVPKTAVEKVENVLGMKVKVFTVYDIPENDECVTCGARSCHFCKRCYTKQDFTEYVVEAKK